MTTHDDLIKEAWTAVATQVVGAPWAGASTGEVDAYRRGWNRAMPLVVRLADALEAKAHERDEAREEGDKE